MKKTDQYIRRYEGCMTDSVAYYLNIHPENVPLFVKYGKNWSVKFRSWWKKRGYEVKWDLCKTPPKKGKHIIVGDSLVWKKYSHMVVYKNGKLAYDPTYPSKWKDNRITHRLIIKKDLPNTIQEESYQKSLGMIKATEDIINLLK